MTIPLILWYLPDLNRGHTDFQSDALPTELRYPTFKKFCKDKRFSKPVVKNCNNFKKTCLLTDYFFDFGNFLLIFNDL